LDFRFLILSLKKAGFALACLALRIVAALAQAAEKQAEVKSFALPSSSTPGAAQAGGTAQGPFPAPTAVPTKAATLVSTPAPAQALATAVPVEAKPSPSAVPTPAQALVPLTASAASQAGLAQAAVAETKTNGFFTDFGLAQYLLFNGAPLSYNLALGYEFENGLRLRTALENYFYAGDEDNIRYSYSYNNWVNSLDFAIPASSWLRPFAGVSMELIANGQRSLENVKDAKMEPARGFFGMGFAAGALLRLDKSWEAVAEVRLIATFSAVPNIPVIGLGAVYHFK
jgi:hypothetical protein